MMSSDEVRLLQKVILNLSSLNKNAQIDHPIVKKPIQFSCFAACKSFNGLWLQLILIIG